MKGLVLMFDIVTDGDNNKIEFTAVLHYLELSGEAAPKNQIRECVWGGKTPGDAIKRMSQVFSDDETDLPSSNEDVRPIFVAQICLREVGGIFYTSIYDLFCTYEYNHIAEKLSLETIGKTPEESLIRFSERFDAALCVVQDIYRDHETPRIEGQNVMRIHRNPDRWGRSFHGYWTQEDAQDAEERRR